MRLTVSVTDDFLEKVAASVGSRQPESGGAILGPSGHQSVTHFQFDPKGAVTGASYIPSDALQDEVSLRESQQGLQLKGILHSHPGGMNRLSGTDVESFGHYLDENPHLPFLIAPIGTFPTRRNQALDGHELQVGALRLSWFAVLRGRSPIVEPVQPSLRPIGALRQALLSRLGGSRIADTFSGALEGAPTISIELSLADGRTVLVTVTEAFPLAAPSVMVSAEGRAQGKSLTALPLPWDLGLPATDRLADFADHVLSSLNQRTPPSRSSSPSMNDRGEGDDSVSRAPLASRSSMQPSGLARAASLLTRSLAGLTGRKDERAPDLLLRSSGFLDRAISGERALIVGCGSVGSAVATLLTRAGVGSMVLIDPDTVASHNIGRSEYGVRDVGMSKTSALAGVLRRINPAVVVDEVPTDMLDISAARLAELVQESSVVVGACDSPRAQGRLAHFAYIQQRPAVFVGVYAKAAGGEVIASLPPGPCFNCAVRTREDLSTGTTGSVDYDTGRLVAEPGLYADVRTIASFATKLALAATRSLPADSQLHQLLDEQRRERGAFVALGVSPDFWFFPSLFGELPGQHAFQSVWLSVERSPECSTCGTDPSGLEEASLPSLGTLRSALGQEG